MKSLIAKLSSLFVLSITLMPSSACAAEAQIHHVPVESISLETMVLMPEDGVAQTGVVFFSRGSGNSDMRDYFPGFRELFIEQVFLPNGYAVVYQNKRGIGRSGGNWKMGSIEQRANDLLSVVEYYKSLPDFNTSKIGLVGHSQGGWVAQYLSGASDEFDFVVSLAGPTVTVAESDLERSSIDYQCEGLEGKALMKKMAKRERLHQRMISIGGWFPYFDMRFMKNILPFDPTESLMQSETPVLIALGSLDLMAPAESNQDRLNTVFPNGLPNNIQLIVEPEADHYFRHTDSMCIDWQHPERYEYSKNFHQKYTQWLEKVM